MPELGGGDDLAARLAALAARPVDVAGLLERSVARARRRRRRQVIAAVFSVVLLLLAAGVGITAAQQSNGTSAASPVVSVTPAVSHPAATPIPALGGTVSGLVGLWAVQASDEASSTRLIIDGTSDLTILRVCGEISGTWRAAASGPFISQIFAFSGACSSDGGTAAPTVAWLARAVAFRADSTGWELLGPRGVLLATLTPGTKTGLPPAVARDAVVTTLNESQRLTLDRAVPALPAGHSPATHGDLIGTWVPVGAAAGNGYITLRADGSYIGSDGCNTLTGAWDTAENGELLVTLGVSGAVGCIGDTVNVPQQFSQAAVAGIDGQGIDLFGASVGALTSRFEHGTPPPTP